MKRKPLTVDKVVEKAIEFADSEGFDSLSMRKLATALNVTAMSLYNHVQGKEGLIDLMLNAVIAEIEIPAVDDEWDVMMRSRAHNLRRALLRHHWASTMLISRITLGDAILRDIEATVGCLVRAGFTYAQADWARNAIDSQVYGFTIQEVNFPVEPEQYKLAAAQYLPMLSQKKYPYMYSASLEVVEGKYDGLLNFDFGLNLIISGLKQWLAEENKPE